MRDLVDSPLAPPAIAAAAGALLAAALFAVLTEERLLAGRDAPAGVVLWSILFTLSLTFCVFRETRRLCGAS